METTVEKMLAYTVEQIQDIAVREASKMVQSLRNYTGREDFIQEYHADLSGAFVMGALTATAKLDPERNGNRSFQWKSGNGAMLDRLNEIKAEYSERMPSIHAEIGGDDEGESDSLIDAIADEKSENPAEAFGLKLNCEALREAMALLTEEQKAVMLARYVDGLTTEATAEALGKYLSWVHWRELEALKILRGAMAA
jgi:RNA polymerase sigma factor (sigma-70 family)